MSFSDKEHSSKEEFNGRQAFVKKMEEAREMPVENKKEEAEGAEKEEKAPAEVASFFSILRGCPSPVKGDRLRTCWRRACEGSNPFPRI